MLTHHHGTMSFSKLSASKGLQDWHPPLYMEEVKCPTTGRDLLTLLLGILGFCCT
jgi:hypothetical protein